MSGRRRETIPIGHPRWHVQITDDGSRTLVSADGTVAFHSAAGALSETRHVYLENSGVAQRIRNGIPTSVLEIGLGTGMGMLVTLGMPGPATATIHYTALESQWLAADVIGHLRPHQWTEDSQLVDGYLRWRADLPKVPEAGVYSWNVDPRRRVSVEVALVQDWRCGPETKYDAVYFDPFAPATNPEIWTAAVIQQMHSILSPGGRLVSYCVNRKVREMFIAAGLKVEAVPGPANGKREVLIATRPT